MGQIPLHIYSLSKIYIDSLTICITYRFVCIHKSITVQTMYERPIILKMLYLAVKQFIKHNKYSTIVNIKVIHIHNRVYEFMS